MATGRVQVLCSCGEWNAFERLFSCTHCGELRCPRCVQDEIVSYYCPNCLLDVPSATVKSGRSRCVNNCFNCPICASIVSTVSVSDTSHHLACSVCRWSSISCGLSLPKPSGFIDIVRKQEIAAETIEGFDRLQESLSQLAISQTLTRMKSSLSSQHIAEAPAIELSTYNQNTSVTVAEQSTLIQRLRWPAKQPSLQKDLFPERVPLAVKRSRRCRTCGFNLIKPDAKAQTVKFSIHLCAYLYLPSLRVFELPKQFLVNQPCVVLLKIVNPLERPAVLQVTSDATFLTVPAIDLPVNAFNEVGEYDDDDDDHTTPAQVTTATIYQKLQNYVIFSVLLTLQQVVSLVKLPLHVAITYPSSNASDRQKLVTAFDVAVELNDLVFSET